MHKITNYLNANTCEHFEVEPGETQISREGLSQIRFFLSSNFHLAGIRFMVCTIIQQIVHTYYWTNIGFWFNVFYKLITFVFVLLLFYNFSAAWLTALAPVLFDSAIHFCEGTEEEEEEGKRRRKKIYGPNLI